MPRIRCSRPLALALAVLHGVSLVAAQSDSPDPVRAEDLRRTVELAIADALRTQSSAAVDVDRFTTRAHELAALGPEVVPALASELAQALPSSYFFCAYSLGLIGGPEAAQALEQAVARAESEDGDFALNRKAWACHGLGLLGRADALDLLNDGRHVAAGVPVHAGMSALEAIAVLTAPAGMPLLVAQIDRYDDESDPNAAQRSLVLESLARMGDASVIPTLERQLASPRVALRHHAARAIGAIAAPRSLELLFQALSDSDSFARTGAALGMRDTPPVSSIPRLLDHLDGEEDAIVRGEIYQLVVRYGGPDDLSRLERHWGRPTPTARGLLLRAVAPAPPDFALPILARGVSDPDASVRVHAATSVARLGDPRGVDLLAPLVASPDWSPAQAAIDGLASLGDPRGAAPILTRLIDTELPQRITDPRQRLRIEKLLLAVVALRDTSRIADLAAAREATGDGQVRQLLDRQLTRLRAIAEAGNKSKRWVAMLDSPDADVRLLAYSALGRVGNEAAAKALAERFGRVDPSEGREILRALGSIAGPTAKELIRRVLVDPAFDPAETADLRDMAAWSGLRIGGEPMRAALHEAVLRRDGRDGRPFLYYVVLAGADSIAEIDRLRVPRLRWLGSSRGTEDERLQWARRELLAGRSVAAFDVPPEELNLR